MKITKRKVTSVVVGTLGLLLYTKYVAFPVANFMTEGKRLYDSGIWLNYKVDAFGTISLSRPDLPMAIPTSINILQLPRSCAESFDPNNWKPGTEGRLAFDESACRVAPGELWNKSETRLHYYLMSSLLKTESN